MAETGTTHKPQPTGGNTAHRARTEDARAEMIPPMEPADTMLVKGPPEGDKQPDRTVQADGGGSAETGTTPSKFAIGAGVVICVLVLLVLSAIF